MHTSSPFSNVVLSTGIPELRRSQVFYGIQKAFFGYAA
jgi:hypothetical protein